MLRRLSSPSCTSGACGPLRRAAMTSGVDIRRRYTRFNSTDPPMPRLTALAVFEQQRAGDPCRRRRRRPVLVRAAGARARFVVPPTSGPRRNWPGLVAAALKLGARLSH